MTSSIDARQVSGRWGWILADGILGVIVGLIALLFPIATVLVLAVLLGIGLLISGIIEATVAGEWEGSTIDAGLLIHEGQLTFGDAGLSLVVDLGVWWAAETGLPLPLRLVGTLRGSLDALAVGPRTVGAVGRTKKEKRKREKTWRIREPTQT